MSPLFEQVTAPINLNVARQNSLALESIGFDRPILSFSGLGLLKASDISRSGIARMSGPMHLEAGLPILDVSGSAISDADFRAGTIEAQNSRMERIFSGRAIHIYGIDSSWRRSF